MQISEKKSRHFRMMELTSKVTQMYLRGSSQQEIAKEVNLSPPRVSELIKKAKEEYYKSVREALEEKLVDQIQRISYLEKMCWIYLEKSEKGEVQCLEQIQEALRRVKESGASKDTGIELPGVYKMTPVGKFTEKRVTSGKPDHQWANLILKCLDMKNKLYGLYEDVSININSTQVNTQVNYQEIVEELAKPPVDVESLINEGIPQIEDKSGESNGEANRQSKETAT